MQKEIDAFISYLHNVKKTSSNTELSYQRDLKKFVAFLEKRNVKSAGEITKDDLSAYMDYMKTEDFKPATISRNVASIKALFHFMAYEGMVKEDISSVLKSPKI